MSILIISILIMSDGRPCCGSRCRRPPQIPRCLPQEAPTDEVRCMGGPGVAGQLAGVAPLQHFTPDCRWDSSGGLHPDRAGHAGISSQPTQFPR